MSTTGSKLRSKHVTITFSHCCNWSSEEIAIQKAIVQQDFWIKKIQISRTETKLRVTENLSGITTPSCVTLLPNLVAWSWKREISICTVADITVYVKSTTRYLFKYQVLFFWYLFLFIFKLSMMIDIYIFSMFIFWMILYSSVCVLPWRGGNIGYVLMSREVLMLLWMNSRIWQSS